MSSKLMQVVHYQHKNPLNPRTGVLLALAIAILLGALTGGLGFLPIMSAVLLSVGIFTLLTIVSAVMNALGDHLNLI